MATKKYIIEYLELMKEWNWKNNNSLGLYPDQLTHGSHVAVSWKCANGHSWDAQIKSRVRGNGCKFCAGQAFTPDRALAIRYPSLVKEWDYETNYPLTPNDVTYGARNIVHWICPTCKYSYPQNIQSKVAAIRQKKKSNSCKVCLGQYIIPEYNSLKALYPNIAKEWDYENNTSCKPEDIAPKTNKTYYWKCSNGHSYPATPNNKVKGKSKCNICYLEENSLSKQNSILSLEWHPTKNGNTTPENVTFGCNDSAWWLCPICFHEWEAKINNRNIGRGCPNCSKGQHTSFSEQAVFYYVSKLFPDAINGYIVEKREIDIYIPSINIGIEYDGGYYHSTIYKFIKDKEKNEFLHSKGINLIRIRETDCYPMLEKYCKIFPIIHTSDYRNLKTVIELVIKYISKSINIPLKIEIDIEAIHNEIISEIHHIKFEDTFASFIIKHPNKIKANWDYAQNVPLTPEMVKPKSGKCVHWICKNNPNHMWEAPIHSISNGYGCRWCANRHQYTTKEWVEKAMEVHADIYDYSNVDYKNSKIEVLIICAIHGEFSQIPSSHLSGKGCRFCAGQGGFHEFNTLAYVRSDLAKEWDYDKNNGLTPYDVIITDSLNEYWWKCNNGKPHSYKAKINYRIKRNSGCAVCHGKQIADDTSLAFLRPDLIDEWHDSNIISPMEVSLGSEKIAIWKCYNPDHPPYEMAVGLRVLAQFGCQICSGRKKTHDSFCKEIKIKFSHIKIISKYQGSAMKINSICDICGTKRTATATNLLNGKIGCLKCKI